MKTAHIVPVILAAGNSVRMGYPKALLPLGKGNFLTGILDTLETSDLADPRVVLGKDAERIRQCLAGRRARILINPDPNQGQISSIQQAVASLDSACGGCLIWPVDQPVISATLVHKLIRLFWDSGAMMVLPSCGGRKGHPAIFHHGLFSELLAEPLGKGLKEMVRRHEPETALLQTDERSAVEDIDTPEDYFKLTGATLAAALARINL